MIDKLIDRQRAMRAAGLFGLLVAIYFLTYSGQAVSTDELVLFDGAHSFVNNGTLELAYTNDIRPYTSQPNNHPVIWLDVEPMQAYAAVPLLWLASRLPGIGVVQTTWLLNIFVTALTAVVLFYYGVALGYKDRSALAVALVFGLATIAWPYSKLFFREPLFTLLVLTCVYGLERWRQHLDSGRLHVWWLLCAVVALVGALFTKEAGLLLVPTLLTVALPGAIRRLFNRRVVIVVATGVVVIIVAIMVYRQLVPNGRFGNVLQRLDNLDLRYFEVALTAYLFSPGASLWAFSPVLLIGWAGAYRLLRQRRMRQVLVPLAMLSSITVGYAALQGAYWYSGTGWGPRFLVPITPFLALWLLPIAEALLDRRVPAWAQGIAVGLSVQSFFIQIVGVIVPIKAFGTYLYNESVSLNRLDNQIVPWQDGAWNPLYIPPVVNAHQSGAPSPIAWIVNGSGWIVLPLCLLAILLSVHIVTRRASSWRAVWLRLGALALSLVILIVGGLRTYYRDLRFGGNNPALWNVLDNLNAEARPGDAVLLNDGAYRDFFMNYYKRREPIYIMPIAPGEARELDKPPEIVSGNPEDRIHAYTTELLARLALTTSRWWFVTEFGPFSAGRLRPVEQYLVRHYFPAREVVSDPNIRLLTFAPADAPSDQVPPWPTQRTDFDYGAARLVGFDLPRSTTIQRGTLLPVSLLWRHDGWGSVEPFDYSVNVSLISRDGVAVAQRAQPPLGTFGPMSQWIAGGYYRDNHALEISADLPPGDYDLWVLIFDWRTGKSLPLRNAAGEHAVIGTIHVTE